MPFRFARQLFAASLGLMAPAFAQADYTFYTDFDSGLPPEFSGAGSLQTVQGFAGLGHAGNTFSGSFLRNSSTGNPAPATVLTLSDLPAHSSISLAFLFAAIDSWDGFDNGFGPDYLEVSVDGVSIFRETFNNGVAPGTYDPPPGVQLTTRPFSNLGFSGNNDSAFDMSLDPIFANIAHSGSTLTIRWFASGPGWQGGNDESWAIDNVRVTLSGTAVPEPSSMALSGLALAGLALASARARRAGHETPVALER